jgi:hypothetical protein
MKDQIVIKAEMAGFYFTEENLQDIINCINYGTRNLNINERSLLLSFRDHLIELKK